MRVHIASVLLAASIPGILAVPQAGIASLSSCIQSGFLNLIQVIKCDLTNTGCLCQQPGILTTIRDNITGKCGASDAQAAVAFGQLQCAAAGYNLAAPAAANTPAAVSDSTSTTAVPSTTVTSTLESASPTISTTVAASIASSMPTMVPAGNSTWNGTMISPATFTGSADNVKMGGIAAALLGAAIVFAML